MNQYQAKHIINLAVAGHSGAGKTSLAEAMLYLAGASDRRGKVGDGNTVCDYDPEEIRRKSSISAAVAPLEWKNNKINLLDAPGLFDFEAPCARPCGPPTPCWWSSLAKTGWPWARRRPLPPRRSGAWPRSFS